MMDFRFITSCSIFIGGHSYKKLSHHISSISHLYTDVLPSLTFKLHCMDRGRPDLHKCAPSIRV